MARPPTGYRLQARIPLSPRTCTFNNVFAQQNCRSSTPRHLSAFDECNATLRSEEGESKQEVQHDARMRYATNLSERTIKRNEQHEQTRNTGFKQVVGKDNTFRESTKQHGEIARSGIDSPADVHLSCCLPSCGVGNISKQTSKSMSGSVFDRRVDETSIKYGRPLLSFRGFANVEPVFDRGVDERCFKHDRPRLSFRGSADVERNICSTSYGTTPAEFDVIYTGGKSIREEKIAEHDNDRCYLEGTSAFSNNDRCSLEKASSRECMRKSSAAITANRERHNILSETATLSADEIASLLLIRDFAFLHRDAKTHGFPALQCVLALLPMKRDMQYWHRIIRTHVQEVDVLLHLNEFVLAWREKKK